MLGPVGSLHVTDTAAVLHARGHDVVVGGPLWDGENEPAAIDDSQVRAEPATGPAGLARIGGGHNRRGFGWGTVPRSRNAIVATRAGRREPRAMVARPSLST